MHDSTERDDLCNVRRTTSCGLGCISTASKTLHLVVRPLDHKGLGQARWVTRWKPALNAFAITFADRMPAAENL